MIADERANERESLRPIEGANRAASRRLTLRGEFLLALGPAVTVSYPVTCTLVRR